MTTPCPCGSGRLLADCCLPLIDGLTAAPTAEALMRSRYTAHALCRVPYLIATCHPVLQPAQDPADIEEWCKKTEFLRLDVHETKAGGPTDEQGTVRFTAWMRQKGKLSGLHERSTFERVEGRWTYKSGQHQSLKMPGPNDACPCGSGKKYKKCCG